MAKFHFKLQSALNLKNQLEDKLKNELGKTLQILENEKNILRSIESEKEQYIIEFNSFLLSGTGVNKLKEYRAYISHLGERVLLQKENVNFAAGNVDKVREELIKVVQEREALEKLKEKKFEIFMKDQLYKEQKLVDEIVSFKFNSRLSGE